MNITVSIIIPAFNASDFIIRSLNSCLNQTFKNYEVIVINDGSKDKTLDKLIEEFNLFPSKRSFEYQVDCKEIKQIYKSYTHNNHSITILSIQATAIP